MDRNREAAALQFMPQLDALRAFAVLGVVLHHTLWRDPSDWRSHMREALSLGEMGVRLFFVLSGFLITAILLKARRAAGDRDRAGILRAFYMRRVLRIFPLYYVAIAVVALLGFPLLRETLGWHLAYLSNILIGRLGEFPGPPISHLWSLAVEEQFYLCWPLVVLFAPRRWLLPLAGSTLVFAPIFRYALLQVSNPVAAAVWMPSCLDTLGMGATLAILGERGRTWVRPCLPIGLLLLAATTALGGRFQIVLGDTAYALMFAWVVRRAATGFGGRTGKVLTWRPLTYIGSISYGIYLIHHMLPMRLPDYGAMRLLVVLGVTLPLAALSFRFFESPLNRLKRHFPYTQRVTIDVSGAAPQASVPPAPDAVSAARPGRS